MNNVLINGQPGSQIGVTDRALHYGDGVFETIASINGSPRFFDRHMDRLRTGCERLKIPVPDVNLLHDELMRVASDGTSCVVKIIVSRGSGGRGYRPPASPEPTRMVLRYPFPVYPETHTTFGVEVRLCETPLGCNPRLAGIKHLNRLEQVMARSEWDDDFIAEGLMLDSEGHLIDGTMSNLFLVVDGVLLTPDISRCGVGGVMRSVIIDVAAQQDIPQHITSFKADVLTQASEVFITNALIGIWPVNRCAGRSYPVGTITRRLQQALSPLMESIHA